VGWAAAEVILRGSIKERLAAKTKKIPWLTLRDLTSSKTIERRNKGKKTVVG